MICWKNFWSNAPLFINFFDSGVTIPKWFLSCIASTAGWSVAWSILVTYLEKHKWFILCLNNLFGSYMIYLCIHMKFLMKHMRYLWKKFLMEFNLFMQVKFMKELETSFSDLCTNCLRKWLFGTYDTELIFLPLFIK